jgi:hypothetical protein
MHGSPRPASAEVNQGDANLILPRTHFLERCGGAKQTFALEQNHILGKGAGLIEPGEGRARVQ